MYKKVLHYGTPIPDLKDKLVRLLVAVSFSIFFFFLFFNRQNHVVVASFFFCIQVFLFKCFSFEIFSHVLFFSVFQFLLVFHVFRLFFFCARNFFTLSILFIQAKLSMNGSSWSLFWKVFFSTFFF